MGYAVSLLLVVLGFGLTPLLAAGALPGGGTSLLPDDPLAAARVRTGEFGSSELVPVGGMPFEKALRVTTARPPEQAQEVAVVVDVRGTIDEGDACLLRLYVRGRRSASESGEARAMVYVQQNHSPWRKLANFPAAAGDEWRRIDVPFRAPFDAPDGRANVCVHLGFGPQVMELGGLDLVDYGDRMAIEDLPRAQVHYAGREPDAPWRAEADERIERFRKADLEVRVVDASGQGIEGANVSIRMQRHSFGFGAGVTAHMICAESEDGRRYRETVARNYNKVVFENDLKPRFWALGRSNQHRAFRREWVERAFEWLAENEIEVRGHYLTWAPLGERAGEYAGRPEELKADVFAHVRERAAAVGDRVSEWDAINHISGWGVTMEQFFGEPRIYADIMRLARRVAPQAELYVNEGQVLPGGGRRDDYERLVRYLIQQGVAPDGVGFMGHFGAGSLTPPAEIYGVLQRFSRLVPNLQVTELDVDVGTDEQLQADYLRDVMTAAFSHPDVEAVVMWGFWEGRHWKPAAALYRRDWSPKPAGRAWEELVFGRWWTEEDGATDPRGRFAARGFLGDYVLTVTHDGREVQRSIVLPPEGATETFVLE